MKKVLLVVLSVFLLSGVGFAQQTIKIGGIFDLTGATGDVGAPYAEAARNYINYVNKYGGVNGKKIELIDVDYAYKIPQAVASYKEMVSKGVIAILGWGTGDTEAMAPMIAQDKIPYISASYSEHLVFEKTPYNFVAGTTYSDQARLALQWIKDNWKDKSRAPRVALIYNDSGFGRSPIQDAEDFAKNGEPEVEPLYKNALDEHLPPFGLVQERHLPDGLVLVVHGGFDGLGCVALRRDPVEVENDPAYRLR